MTRFPSPSPATFRAVHSNLLLKRKLPKECEQHALRDAAADVSVRVRNGRHVGAHLLVVCRHVNVRRRDGRDQTEQPERGKLNGLGSLGLGPRRLLGEEDERLARRRPDQP